MQALYIDSGNGPVDFTKFVYEWNKIDIRKNQPWLFDCSVAFVSGVPGWREPKRGDYIRFEDSRWESRSPGVPDGVLFTGYVTSDAEYQFLGTRNGEKVYGYKVVCTSEDYLPNSKKVPARTFINKTRGYILRALLTEMFQGGQQAFDTSYIYDGGVERIYQTDPKKLWTDIAADFAASDGFTYWFLDRKVYYSPERLTPPASSDSRYTLVLDEKDPRYNPDLVSVSPVSNEVANDVTVFGLEEPTILCQELFVSDGYQGDHPLAALPYGIDESNLIVDDFTGSDIDSSVWEERDTTNKIQMFEGALNITGGSGAWDGTHFVRSLKGVELTGVTTLRDGEIYFAPSISPGLGILGGLYTSDDCLLADLWCGWRLSSSGLSASLSVIGPAGTVPSGSTIALNLNHHYVLRRTIVSSTFLPEFVVQKDPRTGALIQVPERGVQFCQVAYVVEEINADDPANVIKTRHDLGVHVWQSPEYALYAPVVSYDLHLVMNNVAVTRPSQVAVYVNDQPQIVGSYLDGGTCSIVPDGNRAKLAWYSVMGTSVSLNEAERSSAEVTTIPQRGSKILVSYRKSDASRARVQSAVSIADERRRFKDDGLRQLTLEAEDVKPSPRNTEECLMVAQAKLADLQTVALEGSFEFLTKRDDPTELRYFPLPGDRIPYRVDTPEGIELDALLDVTNVSCVPVGKETFYFTVEVGPINRFDDAQRALMRRRSSSLDDVSIAPREIHTAELMTYDWIPDPFPPKVSVIGGSIVTDMNPWFPATLPSGVTGYEVRSEDGGWGITNSTYVGTYYAPQFTLSRDRREKVVYVKPLRVEGAKVTYSRRPAMIRTVVPRPNTIVISGIDGEIEDNIATFWIPLPKDPDFGNIRVIGPDAADVYIGDGITTIWAETNSARPVCKTATAILENSRIVLTIEMPDLAYLQSSGRSYAINVYAQNLLGEIGPTTGFTATRQAPAIVTPPSPNPIDPSTWSWEGYARNWRVNVYDEDDGLEGSWELPEGTTEWNIGRFGRRSRVEVEPGDEYGYGFPGSEEAPGDVDVPGAPSIGTSVASPPLNNNYAKIFWTPGTNSNSVTDWEVQGSTTVDFAAPEIKHFSGETLQYDELTEGMAIWFRVRGTNVFGTGAWSFPMQAVTGRSLDPISLGGSYNPSAPVINPNWRAGGISGYLMSQVNDASGRSFTGLASDGTVGLDLPFAVYQKNNVGTRYPIIRGDNDVRAMASGNTIWDGGFRAVAALDGNGWLQSAIRYGVGMFNSSGGYYGIIRSGDPESNIDNILDGGTYARTTFNQRNGGGRAIVGFDGNGYLITGILQRTGAGYIGYASMDDRGWRAEVALGVDGNRVADNKTDQYSLINECVVGLTIYGPYRAANGLTADGTGFHRAIDRNTS